MSRAALERTLTSTTFDLLVVGGGAHGAFAAWDAALRGLHVALVERGDFAGETSANSLKIAHGGLRYLQTGDLPRMRESVRERSVLLRAAPHLVRPLPCVMPLGRAGAAKRGAFRTALAINDLVSFDRNEGLRDEDRLPRGRLIDGEEYRERAGSLAVAGATAGMLWYDALMLSPERLVVGVVRAAADAGAVVANHAEARSLLGDTHAVAGARVALAGSGEIDVRSRAVLVTAGPWTERMVFTGARADRPLARAVNVVLRHARTADHAVALPHPTERRMLFAVPWRGRAMLGTAYRSYRGGGAGDDDAVAALLGDLASIAPSARADPKEVALVHSGLLPATGGATLRLAHRPSLIDHAATGGQRGLVSVHGVKWTTARAVAERAVDLCQRRLGRPVVRGGTDRRPIAGGGAGSAPSTAAVDATGPAAAARLARLYGTLSAGVLSIVAADRSTAAPIVEGADVTIAEVLHAIREEWAFRLSDIVMRRTELGTAGNPGDAVLSAVARIAGAELGWMPTRSAEELAALRSLFPPES